MYITDTIILATDSEYLGVHICMCISSHVLACLCNHVKLQILCHNCQILFIVCVCACTSIKDPKGDKVCMWYSQ